MVEAKQIGVIVEHEYDLELDSIQKMFEHSKSARAKGKLVVRIWPDEKEQKEQKQEQKEQTQENEQGNQQRLNEQGNQRLNEQGNQRQGVS